MRDKPTALKRIGHGRRGPFFILLIAALFWLPSAITTAQEHPIDNPRRVLLLHSLGSNFAPWNAIAGRLREELIKRSPYKVDLYEAALEDDRFGPSQDQTPLADYLRARFAERKLDLIIALGAPAARFVQKHRPTLFATTPLLISSAEERAVSQLDLTPNDAVVSVAFDEAKQIEDFLQILPNTAGVVVLIGNSLPERFWADELHRSFQPFTNRVRFDYLNEQSAEEMLAQAARLPPNTAIYYATVRIDALGVPQDEEHFVSRLHAVANAPVFTYIDNNFGNGIVGGPMLSTSELALRSATAAIKILSGDTPGNVKTPPLRLSAPIYDSRELQRWNISESNLPPGSSVVFREPTAWEKYRWQIALLCAVILLQGALISGFLVEHRRRRFAEVQTTKRTAELAHVSRFALAGEFTATIAHELNQPLAAIMTNAETAELMIKSPTTAKEEIGELLADIRRDDQRATNVIGRLRSLLKKGPSERSEMDLNEIAIETIQLLSAMGRGRETELNGKLFSGELRFNGDRIQIQQVIINLIVNAMDAMSAMPPVNREINVTTMLVENFAEVAVSDNGPGIPADDPGRVFEPFFTTKPKGMGMGLSIARNLVEAHGGQLLAENKPSGGATFRIRLPLAPAPE